MRRLALTLVLVACQRSGEDKNVPKTSSIGSAAVGLPPVEQVKPKLDVKKPPADGTKTSTGLVYKKLVDNPSGAAPLRNDTVLINYVGWKTSDGTTFFNSKSFGQPVPLNLSQTAKGFTEALQLIKKGETMMLWVPPEIGYKGPPTGKPEMLAYEIELVAIEPAPPVPPDYNAPPASAKVLKTGAKLLTIKPGSAEKARYFDTVTFDYTAWDSEGRMFDSTEMRKRAAVVPLFKQSAVMEDVLTTMMIGERARFWADAEKMQIGGKTGNLPPGLLCYEIELKSVDRAAGVPPPAPPDVKAPPPDAKKTAKGVFYKVLKTGKGGPKPTVTDMVSANYTGWSTDGRMFDSSYLQNKPSDFSLNGVIAGWTDGVPLMSAGDKYRFWIPDELAYKGNPGKPQGMLVFDIELVSFKPAGAPPDPHGHGEDPHGAEPPGLPPPPDVAAPPKDAKKSPKGVSYKILTAKKGAAHPKETDTVKVHYTGWQTNGKMFDSSVAKGGQPIEFSLQRVIAGWKDGIPMIGVGEKARLWIPEELAYPGGEPSGMLVFDVELLEIKPQ